MIPSVITSGYRRSGIYPFNPDALDYGASKSSSQKKTKKTATAQLAISNDVAQAEDLVTVFTPEEEKRFERRYKNDFDVADPQHMCWLKGRHPDRFQELLSRVHNIVRGRVSSQQCIS